MWWRPEPSSVSPIYMPGRVRTASRPRSTTIESAPYSSGVAPAFGSDSDDCERAWFAITPLFPLMSAWRDRSIDQAAEQRLVGPGHPGLSAQALDLPEKRAPALVVEMRRHLVEEEERRRT